MKDVVRTTSGLLWCEVETSQEATIIGNATQTAFGFFFIADENKHDVRVNRYFTLGDEHIVIGCVALDPNAICRREILGGPVTLFVGHMNQNPFPAYQPEIAELAAVLGVEITPEHSYARHPRLARGDDDCGPPSP